MAEQDNTNAIGLTRADYKGERSTLCPGCGHNTISAQILYACYEMDIHPSNIVKFSGIGCSSKSPTYFLSQSFGFNGLHGRMPSLALGAAFADTSMKVLGVSGDGDTASIGLGQFKHLIRRNLPMVYIVENNGVYGLTKGQFSATAEKGLELKYQGVMDLISACVSFSNREDTLHSYQWGRQHEAPLHDIAYIPTRKSIILDEFKEGETKEVTMHDGSVVVLKKLEKDYDPTDKYQALRMLEEAERNRWLITGLIYVDPDQPALYDYLNLVEEPLNRVPAEQLRPSAEALQKINQSMG